MYTPKHFAVQDQNEIFAFVEQNAFGTLTSLVEGKLFSTHLPFLLSADRKHLLGHVARANPHWEEINDQEVLVTLLGEHAYVSPSWYSSAGVPTWNYQTVHIYGKARAVEDESFIRDLIHGLTKVYETGETPWQPDYKETMLQAIVGIAIEITDVQGKFKLSQNRPEEDRRNVADKLSEAGYGTLAEKMKE